VANLRAILIVDRQRRTIIIVAIVRRNDTVYDEIGKLWRDLQQD
jgi:hypothetical protein